MEFKLRLIGQRLIAEGTTEIACESLSDQFSFEAGQYVELEYPEQSLMDDLGKRREFSIASAPAELPHLRFAFRHSGSAFKQSLLRAPAGATLIARGSYGLLTPPPDNQSLTLIAGGIGITPFRSILDDAWRRGEPRPLTLFYANRNETAAAYLDELRGWQASWPNFKLIEHYGPITPESLTPLTSPASWFLIAGPPLAVNLAQDALEAAGVPRTRLLLEQFTGYE